jgi:hypothetical protein
MSAWALWLIQDETRPQTTRNISNTRNREFLVTSVGVSVHHGTEPKIHSLTNLRECVRVRGFPRMSSEWLLTVVLGAFESPAVTLLDLDTHDIPDISFTVAFPSSPQDSTRPEL